MVLGAKLAESMKTVEPSYGHPSDKDYEFNIRKALKLERIRGPSIQTHYVKAVSFLKLKQVGEAQVYVNKLI